MGKVNIMLEHLPDAPGTYLLLLRLDGPARLEVGRLGAVTFSAGLYAYVGSARGTGGLRARVGRHLRAEKPLHWHIDRLTARAAVVAAWWRESPDRLECHWAQTVLALPGGGFGASDCACRAHLFALAPAVIPAAWAALGQPERTDNQ